MLASEWRGGAFFKENYTLDAEQLTEVLAQLLTRVEASRRCGDEPSRLGIDERGQVRPIYEILHFYI